MGSETDNDPAERSGLVMLAAISLLAGAIAGLLGAAFRFALQQADHWRNALLELPFVSGPLGWLVMLVLCGAAAAVAAWLVRSVSPQASGSGIPHVDRVLKGEAPPAPFWLIPVKFIGGVLAIGAGLALGREGPTVQMGATAAHLIGQLFARSAADCRVLLAAGAGAGLATAFNAPIAGAIFVLEELMRRFDTRTAIATFGASAGAIATSGLLLGHEPDFHFDPPPYPTFSSLPFYLMLGLFAGAVGIAYSRAILGALAATNQIGRRRPEVLAAIIGAAVGVLAWLWPESVGGGEPISQRSLAGADPLRIAGLMFAVRFALGPISYATRTPGGLFSPMLALGSLTGILFGHACAYCLPTAAPPTAAVTVVSIAALFTTVVRAPLTGIILVVELTGCATLLLPMLSACFTAMLLPTLTRDRPIYDALT